MVGASKSGKKKTPKPKTKPRSQFYWPKTSTVHSVRGPSEPPANIAPVTSVPHAHAFARTFLPHGVSAGPALDGDTPVTIVDPYNAVKQGARATYNPFTAQPVAIPDQFTKYPTAMLPVYRYANPAINMGTTGADGNIALLFRNDPYHTVSYASFSSGSAISTFSVASGGDMCGALTTNHRARICFCYHEIEVIVNGDPRDFRASCTYAPPDVYATQITSGSTKPMPTDTSLGATANQKIYCGGYDEPMQSHGNHKFRVFLPTMSTAQATAFTDPSVDKGLQGGGAYFVWLYGLRSTDLVSVHSVVWLQYYPITAGTWIDPTRVMLVGSNSTAADLWDGLMTARVATGANTGATNDAAMAKEAKVATDATDKMVDTAKSKDFVDNVVDSLGKALEFIPALGGLLGPQVPTRVALGLSRGLPPDHIGLGAPHPIPRSLEDDEKSSSSSSRPSPKTIDDEPLMITPSSARRPSLARSLAATLPKLR